MNFKQSAELFKLSKEISFSPKGRLRLFKSLDKETQILILAGLTKPIKKDILTRISEETLMSILESLDPDDTTSILQFFPTRRRRRIIKKLSKDLRKAVTDLLYLESETAAGLMSVNYVQVEESDHIEHVAEKFKLHEKRTGKMPVILVQRDGELVGHLPGHELGFNSASQKVAKYVKKITTVERTASQKEVEKLFKSHPHNKVVVMDEKGVAGIIYSDDVLKAMEEQESSSLYDFAGVRQEESVKDSVKSKVGFRYKWLIINLGTAFLAAFTVGLFEGTISKYVLLAVYMPIVAGMGGNAATQTMAVMVRGIALNQVSLRSFARTLKNEAGASIINGFINGFLVATIVILKDKDYKLAIVLASAMVINLIVAAFFGTVIPLIMKRLGKDPASSATIFITTATDVLGFMAFLGLASIIL
jgi:magnesium transporter